MVAAMVCWELQGQGSSPVCLDRLPTDSVGCRSLHIYKRYIVGFVWVVLLLTGGLQCNLTRGLQGLQLHHGIGPDYAVAHTHVFFLFCPSPI